MTNEGVLRKVSFSRKMLSVVAGLAAVVAPCLYGQAQVRVGNQSGNEPSKLPEFEVATIKPADPKVGIANALLTRPGGRITAMGCTLQYLVMEAFDVKDFQISGGPSWIHSTGYDIEAKAPEISSSSKSNPVNPKNPPNEEERRMLQSLLMDRFQLKSHRESKEGPVYILMKGNNALKLKSPQDEDAFPWVGGESGPLSGSGFRGTNISMAQLSARLSGFLHRPVLDQTGIQGSYDFEYQTGNNDPDADFLSLVITSINEIGLKLKSAKGPVEAIVIDHVEIPSAN